MRLQRLALVAFASFIGGCAPALTNERLDGSIGECARTPDGTEYEQGRALILIGDISYFGFGLAGANTLRVIEASDVEDEGEAIRLAGSERRFADEIELSPFTVEVAGREGGELNGTFTFRDDTECVVRFSPRSNE